MKEDSASMDTYDTLAQPLLKTRDEACPPCKTPEVMVHTGSVGGRIKANPLKHLARLLHKKLEAAQGIPCNLLQVATEIHSEAKDKHNTTFRRIYDVVNVCEGAGVLVRTVQRASIDQNQASQKSRTKKAPIQTPDAELHLQCNSQSHIPTSKRSPRGGAEIRWLGRTCVSTLNEDGQSQRPRHLRSKITSEKEKLEALQRISEKKKHYESISKQVVILKNLLERNQGLVSEAVHNHRCLSDYNWLQHPPPPRSTKRPRSDPVSHSLNLAPMPVAGISRVDGILTCVDSLKLLGGAPGVNKEGGVEQITFSEKENRPLLAQSLHVPFVMLATDSNANVEIFMDGDPPTEVHLLVDKDYQLIDHIQTIQMLLGMSR